MKGTMFTTQLLSTLQYAFIHYVLILGEKNYISQCFVIKIHNVLN